jgi:rubrerythrin
MSQLPAGAPANPGEAFARINAVTAPTIDDFKLMVFLEASAQSSYFELAESAPSAAIADLLRANGREEMAHAHRVAKVIKLLTGEDFPPPSAEQNPYVVATGRKVDRGVLEMLVGAENNGNTLYETWASATPNAEAAEMLRQNGREEIRHGERASQALTLMGA